jgi:hypothetical protein
MQCRRRVAPARIGALPDDAPIAVRSAATCQATWIPVGCAAVAIASGTDFAYSNVLKAGYRTCEATLGAVLTKMAYLASPDAGRE